MNRSQLKRFIDSWIRYHSFPGDPPEEHPDEWAMIELFSYAHNEPELAWRIILAILDRDFEKRTVGMLAAGPLEDLLSDHGSDFIDRVEFEARNDPDFAKMLSGVWMTGIEQAIGARVQRAMNTRGFD